MAELQGSRVLVTGATGLIGANLVPRLATLGCEVAALVRRPGRAPSSWPPVARLVADLRDRRAAAAEVRAFAPTHIVSAAMPTGHASTPAARRAAVEVGLVGTALLLDLAHELAVERFVHLGSSLEYGPRDRPLREDDPLRPVTFRGTVKAAASRLCLQRARSGSVPAVVVRPFSVYGPWEREGRLVPTVLRAALLGQPLRLTVADPVRDFVFVGDVVQAVVAALQAGDEVSGEAVNLGTGVETSNRQVVALVERVTGCRIERASEPHPARPSDAQRWAADSSLARELLGWRATTGLPAGLAATAGWASEQACG